MGRDKRIYRFVQDTRYGRKVLAETGNVVEMVDAVTRYLAQRLVERERALADGALPVLSEVRREVKLEGRHRRRRAVWAFLFGVLAGFATLAAAAIDRIGIGGAVNRAFAVDGEIAGGLDVR